MSGGVIVKPDPNSMLSLLLLIISQLNIYAERDLLKVVWFDI